MAMVRAVVAVVLAAAAAVVVVVVPIDLAAAAVVVAVLVVAIDRVLAPDRQESVRNATQRHSPPLVITFSRTDASRLTMHVLSCRTNHRFSAPTQSFAQVILV